ncbi:DUF4232 domain-containing protein [Curtobacterium sp. MCBD17_030]|uniref:DUF4232 domain-containing protein n=1 Tax=Curtobacterium sp. MCBD17_030 TaxID=2175649 RepID=UPI000D8D2E0E|nr:DUF4232 domain-containing protein [Curtobacterium sp. MCBD17_030]PYY36545.1 DUF4232 domain-containing protein [Curtobacterium sp. MCBD17_030]
MGVLGAVVLALTGCTGGSNGGGASSAPTTSTSSSSSSSVAPVSAAPKTSSAPSSTPASSASGAAAAGPADGGTASGARTCAAASLTGSIVDGGGGGAGSVYLDLALRNTGSASCTLQGWPGLSFVGDGNGTQVGASATLDRSDARPTVTLAAGQTAYAPLRIVRAENLQPGDCTAQQPDGFRVYPPGSKQSLFIASTAYPACQQRSAQLLSVRAFVPEGQQQQ